LICDRALIAELNKLENDIRNFKPPKIAGNLVEAIRAILIGEKGAGKTTFLNSATSSVVKRVTEIGATGSSTVSMTPHVRKISINNAAVDFFDTFGWDESNYVGIIGKLFLTDEFDTKEDPRLMEIKAAKAQGAAAPISRSQSSHGSDELDFLIGIDLTQPVDPSQSKHVALLIFRAVDAVNAGALGKLSLQVKVLRRLGAHLELVHKTVKLWSLISISQASLCWLSSRISTKWTS